MRLLLLAGKSYALHWLSFMLILDCSILCSEYAIKRIDEPFVLPTDDLQEWAI